MTNTRATVTISLASVLRNESPKSLIVLSKQVMYQPISTLLVLSGLLGILSIIGCGEGTPADEGQVADVATKLEAQPDGDSQVGDVATKLETPPDGDNQVADVTTGFVAGAAAASGGLITVDAAGALLASKLVQSGQEGETTGQSGEGAQDAANTQCTVRLVRVRIPSGSTLRGIDEAVPELFVRLLEDGEHIRNSSRRRGNQVEFPRSEKNIWVIRKGHSYSLEVFDHDFDSSNDLIFQVVGLVLEDFSSGSPILEATSMLTPREQAASIEFEVVRNE